MGLKGILGNVWRKNVNDNRDNQDDVVVSVELEINGRAVSLSDSYVSAKEIASFEEATEAARRAWETRKALNDYACTIVSKEEQERAVELVRRPEIRDLDQAEQILATLWNGTSHYMPCFCDYVDIFYKRGDYERASSLALQLHERSLREPDEMGGPVPAPLNLAGKAFRALGREAKKNGDLHGAVHQFRRIAEIDRATDNDLRIIARLEAEIDSAEKEV